MSWTSIMQDKIQKTLYGRNRTMDDYETVCTRKGWVRIKLEGEE